MQKYKSAQHERSGRTAQPLLRLCRSLEERAVADLEHLPAHGAAHFACEVEAGVGLVYRLALGAGEVDEVSAVFEHLRAAGLFARLVRQVCRGYRRAGRYGVAADVCVD